MRKIEVIENEEFTKAFERLSVGHRTRVTVVTNSGERMMGEAGGDKHDLSAQKTDAQIAEKLRGLTEHFLGAKRVNSILERLWNLDDLKDVTAIPLNFVLD